MTRSDMGCLPHGLKLFPLLDLRHVCKRHGDEQ